MAVSQAFAFVRFIHVFACVAWVLIMSVAVSDACSMIRIRGVTMLRVTCHLACVLWVGSAVSNACGIPIACHLTWVLQHVVVMMCAVSNACSIPVACRLAWVLVVITILTSAVSNA